MTVRSLAARSTQHWLFAFALTAAAYALAGALVLPLAIPPGYATPLYPAAGVALASVLILGLRMLPAIAIGSFGINLWQASRGHSLDVNMVVVPMAIGIGAALQAFAGTALMRRFVQQPLTLSEPRDIAVFFGTAALSCAVNPCISTWTLWATGSSISEDLPLTLVTWWIGDFLGVLIALPVLLSFFGRPREAWSGRRLSVGFTLMLVTVLLSLGIRQVVRWNIERVESTFQHDAASAARTMTEQLLQPLQALEALHGLFIGSDQVTRNDMRLATSAWLRPPSAITALGWVERVPRRDIPAFEAGARVDGFKNFTVHGRETLATDTALNDDALAIRLIEPSLDIEQLMGMDIWSGASTREAAKRASLSDMPAATALFKLVRQTNDEAAQGIIIYRAVYSPRVPAPADRLAAMQGAVFVTLRTDRQLNAVAAQLPPHLSLCLVDATNRQAPQRLGGPENCEKRSPSRLQLLRALSYAGRQWELRVEPVGSLLSRASSDDVWLFAMVGLFSTAMLSGFILAMTGRTRRIETAVHDRTAALQAEIHERGVAEGALRESEQRFRNILNNVPIGVIYTDLQGRVRQSNPRFCELIGYSATELLRMSIADYTHPDDLADDRLLMGELMRGELPMYRRLKRYISKDGATVSVRVTVTMLRGSNGEPRSIVGVVEDISEHLKLEAAESAREAAESSNRAKVNFFRV